MDRLLQRILPLVRPSSPDERLAVSALVLALTAIVVVVTMVFIGGH